MKIVVVCGNWDEEGGRPSKVMEKFIDGMVSTRNMIQAVNGGKYEALKLVQEKILPTADAIVWMPQIPNDLPKIRDIKAMYPKKILVTSKANLLGDYSTQSIVAHGLALKANLIIRIDVLSGNQFRCCLLDPLGNSWMHPSYDFKEVGIEVVSQIKRLRDVTRVPTIRSDDTPIPFPETEDSARFLKIVKAKAEIFHGLMGVGAEVTRFLGNSSFRCMRGFPSMRDNGGAIFVSQRNVDKKFIDKDHFVNVRLNISTGDVLYYGDNKPSVDTPIQLALYQALRNVNYMVHSHVYVNEAPFTRRMIPCGGVEEVTEVMDVIRARRFQYLRGGFAVNLIGHGSIIFANDVNDLLSFRFYGRDMPERMYTEPIIMEDFEEEEKCFLVQFSNGTEETLWGVDIDDALISNGHDLGVYSQLDWWGEITDLQEVAEQDGD